MWQLKPEAVRILTEVAEWLEQGAPTIVEKGIKGFNLQVGIEYNPKTPNCGSTCCIAGAICQFEKPFELIPNNNEYYFEEVEISWYGGDGTNTVFGRAVELLGIDEDTAEELFAADNDYGIVTPFEAAQVVRNFIKTGEVTWDKVCGSIDDND